MNRSINKRYWQIWVASVLALIALKAVLYEKTGENVLFLLFVIYIVPMWLWVMYLNYRTGRDLTDYLKKHHNEKWKEITAAPFVGAGGFNSFRSLPFIFSNDIFPSV